MTYTQIEIITTNTDQSEILIAQLANIGFESFEEEENLLKAFINANEFKKEAVNEIIASHFLTYAIKEIEQQNWNAQWESSFEPVIVNDFAAVRASFHQPITSVQHEIIITPKMSFGTGHHATTFLMMQQMSAIDFIGKTVFDFGTGTGVLAILAEKMGATQIDAIDNDEWSINNTIENTQANGCSHINVFLAEKIAPITTYDIILANINLNVITAAIKDISAICKGQTKVLFSGFLPTDFVHMESLLLANNYININKVERNNWLCITCTYGA
jgi:ribosomal protein L11 methyltransferase